MALAPCPDCKNQCSLLATACPRCGRPFKVGDLVAPEVKWIRALGVLSFLVLAGAVLMAVVGALQFDPGVLPADRTGGFMRPVMALEFVETTDQASVILDQNNQHNRPVMRNQLYIDFVWLGCYGLLYLALSYLLARRNCPWARYLSCVAAICGAGAAAFDVRENLGMLQVVNDPTINQSILASLHIRDAAIVKWTLSFVTMALLATTFYGVGKKLGRIGFFFTLTALAGFIGLWYKPLLGVVVPPPMLIGLVLLTYTAWRSPQILHEPNC
jgi:hypothetical protein